MPRPYKALQKQGYRHYFTALTGRTRIADIAIIHSKISFVGYCGRGVPRPYGGGSITACHGAPLQPQCYLKIRSAHSAGEACLAHSCFLSFLLCKCVEDFPAFGTAGYEFFESGAELFTKRVALHGGALLACLYEFQM